jgi:hypothetical protein
VTTFLDSSTESDYSFISADGNSTDRFGVLRKAGCTFEPGFEEIGKSFPTMVGRFLKNLWEAGGFSKPIRGEYCSNKPIRSEHSPNNSNPQTNLNKRF